MASGPTIPKRQAKVRVTKRPKAFLRRVREKGQTKMEEARKRTAARKGYSRMGCPAAGEYARVRRTQAPPRSRRIILVDRTKRCKGSRVPNMRKRGNWPVVLTQGAGIAGKNQGSTKLHVILIQSFGAHGRRSERKRLKLLARGSGIATRSAPAPGTPDAVSAVPLAKQAFMRLGANFEPASPPHRGGLRRLQAVPSSRTFFGGGGAGD